MAGVGKGHQRELAPQGPGGVEGVEKVQALIQMGLQRFPALEVWAQDPLPVDGLMRALDDAVLLGRRLLDEAHGDAQCEQP